MTTEAAARDADHLTGFDCLRCGHSGAAHYRSHGKCRACSCTSDPLCWCGVLASKHDPSFRSAAPSEGSE